MHDYEEVFFRVGANVDPKRDVLLTRGAARPPRPRADAAVLRRQARDRRDAQGPGRGDARVAAGDRDERRGARPRDAAAGTSTGSRSLPLHGTGKCVRVSARAVWCVVDRGTESRPTASPGSEPLADRLRDRRRVRPRRPGHQLAVAAVGAAIAVICAAFWIRDSTRGYSTPGRASSRRRAPRADAAAVATRAGPSPVPVDGRGSSATRARCSSRARRSASAR